MNNPRKYTSEEYAEVRVWSDELPVPFLVGLPKDKLSRTLLLGAQNILFGNSAVTQILNVLDLFWHLTSRYEAHTCFKKCNWRSEGYFSEASCSFSLEVSWGHISGNFSSGHLRVFISRPPSNLTPEKSKSVLKYSLAIPLGTKKKKKRHSKWVTWRSVDIWHAGCCFS